MNKSKKYLLGLIVISGLLIIASQAYAIDSKEYLNEFSEPGENCEIIDVFTYQILTPTFFNSNHYSSTVQVFYLCSIENQSTPIIYDVYDSKFSDKRYISELVDLNYIKYNLQNNHISEQYFISNGIDVCDYYDDDTLNEESINLASSAIEQSTSVMNPKTAKEVTSAIQLGKNLNLIGKFNPANFIASVGCAYRNNKVKHAVESLAICNAYLRNIRNNLARNGYVSELTSCITNAKTNFKIYLDSTVTLLIDTVNKAGNLIDATLIRPIKSLMTGLASGSYETPDMSIEKSERDIAQEIYNSLSNSETYFHNPKNAEIVEKHLRRVEFKTNQGKVKYSEILPKFEHIKSMKPFALKVVFTNLFYEPNYNISEAKESLSIATKKIEAGTNNYEVNKFNSALNMWALADIDLDYANDIFARENSIIRNFDKIWYLVFGVLLIVSIYIVRKRRAIFNHI